MHASPDPALVWLYQRAQIMQAFPGSYTLDGLKREKAIELLQAMELLHLARAAQG